MAVRRRRTFPLVPRHRLSGIAFGTERSLRRGQGTEVAGSRPYRPGDRLAWIDWAASARLSAAQSRETFIVREYFAEEAPRVVLVADRRPSMALYPPGLPWLSKPGAVREAAAAIVASTLRARGAIGYLDHAGGSAFWVPPHGVGERWRLDRRLRGDWDAPADTVARAIDHLLPLRRDVPAGAFVFVVSDFLVTPERQIWLRAAARRWEIVPVIVQDPVWEQSFPPVQGVVVPVADPANGRVGGVRLTARETRARRERNERRLRALVEGFRALRIDPILLGSEDPGAVDAAFLAWAERRRRLLRAVPA